MEIDTTSYEHFRPIIKKPSTQNKRYEAVVNYNCLTNWAFKLHESYDERKDRIHRVGAYDLCVFQYTKNKSLLSVENSSGKVILKEPKENAPDIPLEAVWEIQPIDLEDSKIHDLYGFGMGGGARGRGVTMQADQFSRAGGGRNSLLPGGLTY